MQDQQTYDDDKNQLIYAYPDKACKPQGEIGLQQQKAIYPPCLLQKRRVYEGFNLPQLIFEGMALLISPRKARS